MKSINKLYAFHLLFLYAFLPVVFFLSVFGSPCVRSVCVLSVFISGADLGPYSLLGGAILWWYLVVDCYCRKFLLWYFLVLTMVWKLYCLFRLVFILLICYLHCYYTIQMHVEFNNKDQIRSFYRPNQRWIQGNS